MGNKITPLVSKMLFTEQLLQRIGISQQIFRLLQASAYEKSGVAKIIRNHFFARVKACALNPSSRHRKSLFEIAKFFDSHADQIAELSRAA